MKLALETDRKMGGQKGGGPALRVGAAKFDRDK